jgi:hypothetical protein
MRSLQEEQKPGNANNVKISNAVSGVAKELANKNIEETEDTAETDAKFFEEVAKITKDTAIQVECKIRPQNAAEKVDPSRKQKSYDDDPQKIKEGDLELKQSDLVNSQVDYPVETFTFKKILCEIKDQKKSHDADFERFKKIVERALAEDVNCSVFAYG